MIRNERLKLLAGALNNLGLAFAIGGSVAPVIGGKLPVGYAGLVPIAWFVLGAALHGTAQFVLGRLAP